MKIEERPDYYRGNRTFADVLREEFAFSLIYNNIAPEKMHSALRSVGLSQVPNVFLLIQVDDYSNESKRFSVENEFVIKVRILDIVRAQLEKSHWEHMAANLTGTDNVIAFLHVDGAEDYSAELSGIAREICEKVHRFANYTVSICVSNLCEKTVQISRNYERAKVVLQESFFLGKKIQTKVISAAEDEKRELTGGEIDRHIQNIYVSLSRGDRALFGQALVQLFNGLQKNRQGRAQALLLAAQLIDKMNEYVLSCGVKEEKYAAAKMAGFKEDILRCGYADDVCVVLLECYETLWELLDRVQGRSADSVFQEMVRQYIKDHFQEKIYLDEIALSCGYSKYYFCRQMKKCFGMGLSDCVNSFRIERAKELLRGGYQTIEEIVHETGFSSANYFEIVFRRNVGLSPSAYRKMKKEE